MIIKKMRHNALAKSALILLLLISVVSSALLFGIVCDAAHSHAYSDIGMLSFEDLYGTDSNANYSFNAFGFDVSSRDIYDIVYTWQNIAPPLLILSMLFVLLSLILLIKSAGYGSRSEELRENAIDKIPYDLFSFILLAIGFVSLMVTAEFGYELNFYIPQLLSWLLALLFLLIFALALMFILSTATRIKMRTIFKNTLIYKFISWFFNGTKNAVQGAREPSKKAVVGVTGAFSALISFILSLILAVFSFFRRIVMAVYGAIRQMVLTVPLVWRSTLVVCAILFIEVLLVYAMRFSEFYFALFLVYNAFVVLLAFYGAFQIRILKLAAVSLAEGDIDSKIDTSRMYFDFKEHGDNLNKIADGMSIVVDQRMKSERLKTELITNVSHDIKTPLTSIINYVDLLEHTDEDEDKKKEYLEVLSRQSARLKKLIEDLIEASKASTGNISVSLENTNVAMLIEQAVAEYSDKFAESGLTSIVSYPDKSVYINADGKHMWRVLDNVLSNVCKYALQNTRVYINTEVGDSCVSISVKNISRESLNVSADDLTERFVRGDDSRSTEGSGLGLNIARSLTELQGGNFEISVDGDLFRVKITIAKIV